MMNPDRAAEQLKTFECRDWEKRVLAAAKALPDDPGKVALVLLGRDKKGRPLGGAGNWERLYRAKEHAGQWLDALDEGGRHALLEALFGRLAPAVEQGYRLLFRLPYQSGGTRKPFRAPAVPEATRSTRFDWLADLLRTTGPYQQDVEWFAAWAPYLGWYPDHLGWLFAGVIDAGGQEGDRVFEVLLASARGDHEVGAMGRHVSRALLSASRPEGWDFMERMLLAAQRQEGLRQTILETVDEAHPGAFRRMLRVILDHDLARFSAVVRAVDVWFGFSWDSVSAGVVAETIQRVLRLLEHPAAPALVLSDPAANATDLYLALWALAFEDGPAAVEPAALLLQSADVERRFAGAHLLSQLRLRPAYDHLLSALDDADLRVAVRAFDGLTQGGTSLADLGQFDLFERLLARLPGKQRRLEPLIWPWMIQVADRETVADALAATLFDRQPRRLIPYLKMMNAWRRSKVVALLAEREKHDAEAREAIFSMVGDPSSTVREQALNALETFKITREDAERFEKLLTRKAGDLRRGIIGLLLRQPDAEALASARRLAAAGDRQQRLAGLELLKQLADAGRGEDECHAVAESFRRSRPDLATDEEKLLQRFAGANRQGELPTLDNGLGLYDPAERTRPARPGGDSQLTRLLRGKKTLLTDAAAGLIRSLDDLVHEHREMPVMLGQGNWHVEDLLANAGWRFPQPQHDLALEEDLARLPLAGILQRWWDDRPPALRDPDGMELPRALAPFETGHGGLRGYHYLRERTPSWLRDAFKVLYAGFDVQKLRYREIVQILLAWILRMHPPQGAVEMLLDNAEFSFSVVPENELKAGESQSPMGWVQSWRTDERLRGWLDVALYHRKQYPEQWAGEHQIRLWKLLRWIDEPAPGMERMRPDIDLTLAAYEAGGAGEADVLDQLIGPRPLRSWGHGFGELYRLSGRKPAPELSRYPFLASMVDRCRRRIVELELSRGDLPTAASGAAMSLRWTGGLDALVRVLAAMGGTGFVRGWSFDSQSKACVVSHLARGTFPGEDDTRDRFGAAMLSARIGRKRLLELAMYAPQWAGHVERTLEWPQLEEAVWWLHAHTKDTGWAVDREIRDIWAAQVSERTALSSQGLLDGAVDVRWFNRVYAALGEERWRQLYEVALYASGGGGHKRAQLFADAMLGRLDRDDLLARIRNKRNQDAVRALGLLPLPTAEGEARRHDLLERYKAIKEFLRTSKQFGSQRQVSEKLAASIGLENLARTAGYADPVRFEWVMEGKAVEDLAAGALHAAVGEVAVCLSINTWGQTELAVSRNGKELKNIPPAARKDPAVVALREREREVTRQAARVRLSLEEAMCRGDEFTPGELRGFFDHPLLRPMVEGLVFVAEGQMGYPTSGGKGLRACDGTTRPVGENERLRLAHPYDLFATGNWHSWQHELFAAERVQPFKQVFRELYLPTTAERSEGDRSRRYEGQQVNPNQALALLGSRGWVAHPEEGVRRSFHDAGISAWITFLGGFYTPAEVDGLTLGQVAFSTRGEWQPMALRDVPPRIFSEVMRDLDLVVSVAHRGGVDPEATASTVEMRASLIRETSHLLRLGNVRLQGQHALVEGKLATYSVHLGSGVVHHLPGRALCIIPVHSQHRGRIFLPFADGDPKTAEVLSKILLLARDADIQDPTILEQILPASLQAA